MNAKLLSPDGSPISDREPPSLIYDSEEEHQAQLDSVFWFHDQRSAGKLQQYEGQFVAVLGESILDTDREELDLVNRLEAEIDTDRKRRIVIQYVPGLNEWNYK